MTKQSSKRSNHKFQRSGAFEFYDWVNFALEFYAKYQALIGLDERVKPLRTKLLKAKLLNGKTIKDKTIKGKTIKGKTIKGKITKII